MEVNKIQEELARLIELVDGWAGSHDVPGIERDLVLDKLKKLYEAIRFANFDEGDSSASASVAAQQSVAEVAPVSEISIDLDDLLAEPVRDSLPEPAAMPEALGESAGVSAAVPESAPSVKPVSASAVTEPEPEPVLVVASAPVAEPDPVLADESAPESVPVSESAPAAESIAVAVAVSVTSGLSRQDASMEGQSDKASGTGHDAAVRTGREVRSYLDGTFTDEKIAAWDERLKTVFNRGFWDGYYLGQRLGEWTKNYGSAATERKIYVGKGIRYFSNIGVAEFLVEAAELNVGDKLLITGPTTGAVFTTLDEARVDLKPVQTVKKGQHFSMKADKIRPSDKLYKLVSTEELKKFKGLDIEKTRG